MRPVPELAFVMSPGQNWFFVDLVAAIRSELDAQGVVSSVSTEGFPEPRQDRVYVLVPPHEYVALEGIEALPSDEMMGRTIMICAEQPSTVHFDQNLEFASKAGSIFDINARAVAAFRRHGVVAHHLQLGYSRHWDHFEPQRERDIDVLFLGSHSQRRSHLLNSYARIFSGWRSHIQISDNSKPNTGQSTSFLADDKWDLISRAKLMINIHQGEEPYFEWLRALEAFHGGAVLLSEHADGIRPLVQGQHLYAGRPESLGYVADGLLRDAESLDRVRREAYSFIRGSLPFAASVAALAGAARALVARPLHAQEPTTPLRPMATDLPRPVASPPRKPTELSLVRMGLKQARTELLTIRRQLGRLEGISLSPDHQPQPLVRRAFETRGWRARRRSAVTVLTALYNHQVSIEATLDSVVASDFRDIEIVVVDDGSTDRSGETARDWMRENEDIAALLVRHPVNRGLGAARNTAMDFARGHYCFVLDSDNKVYPRCVGELVEALDTDRGATFAYPILEAFGAVEAHVAAGADPLVSFFGWEPSRFRHGNYIDALAMIRTDALRAMGGYTTDGRLFGWEDYDLWCRIAEQAGRGRLVPQILAQYQVSPTSLRATTDLSETDAVAALIERHPTLMAGRTPTK